MPEKGLVGATPLLQSRRVEAASSPAGADALTRELFNFQLKATPAASGQFGTRREGRATIRSRA